MIASAPAAFLCSSTGCNAYQAVLFRCAAEGEQLSSQKQAVARDLHRPVIGLKRAAKHTYELCWSAKRWSAWRRLSI